VRRVVKVPNVAMSMVLALLALLSLSACASPVPSVSVFPLPSGEYVLPTEAPLDVPSGAAAVCAGMAINAVVRGDAADLRVAWLVDVDLGSRIDVVWPSGYRARFAPRLEVLDGAGTVVLRDGDHVTGGCVTGDGHLLLLNPPFK